MLRFLPLVFIISTDAAIPSVAIDTCPSDQVPPLPNPYDLDCTAFSTSYADSATEVCCYSSVTDTSGVTTDSIEKYANTCYYDCNQPSGQSGGGYSYYSMANYYCGACCNTAAAAVDPNNCTDPDNTTSVDCTTQGVDQDWGFCPDYTTTGDQCTSCDPAVSDPCLYRGSAYECVSDDSSQPICNKCTHPCEGVSNCEYSASGDTCDVTTTDTDGNVVGTGEVGTCQYTDLANYDLQCLTCEPNPTTTAAATTSDPCPDEPTSPQCTSTGGDCVTDVGGQTVTGTCSMDSTDRCWFCDTTTTNPCPDEPVNTAGIAYCTSVDDDCVDDTGVTGTCDYDTGSNCFKCYPNPTTTAAVSCPNEPVDPTTGVASCTTPSGGSCFESGVSGTCSMDADGCWFCDPTVTDPCDGVSYCATYGDQCDVQGTGEIGSCQYDTNQCLDCVACPDQDTECTALDQDCNDETGTAGICDYDATSATNAVYGCFTCYAVDPCPNTPDECTNIASGTVGPCFITSTSSGMSTTVDGTCALDADGCYFCSETDPCANAYPSCTASTADCDVATMDSTGNWVGTGEVGTCVCTDSCCTCEPDATTTVDPNPDLCADEHPYCTTEGEFCDDVAMDAAGAWVGTGDSGSCEYDTNDCWICDADETTTSAPDATTTSASDPCATEATDCVSTGDTCAVSSDDGVTTTSEGICEMDDNRCWVCVERTDTTETPTDTTSASDTTASEDTTAAGDTTAAADTTAAGDTTAAADTTASADTTAAGDTTADAGTTVAVDTSAVGTLHDPSSAAYRDHYMSIIAVLYAFSFLL
eukprot:871787_1